MSKKDSITRRSFISATATGIGALGLTSAHAANTKKSAQVKTKTPKTKKSNSLNIIVIISDTWRTDHLGCYGPNRVKTPHLDQFAKQSTVFTNVHAEGLPTIPARRVYHTGKSVLPKAQWRPLSRDDVTFAEVLSARGYTTGFVCDTYHHFQPDFNFHKGFHSWEWIRGQEFDRWRSGPKAKFNPRNHIPDYLWNEDYDYKTRQYLMNTQDFKTEDDYFAAQSCRAAEKWLELNAQQKPFMLFLEMFDPHEPWDAPPRFQKMYRDKYPFERYIFGYGVWAPGVKPEEFPVIRDLYAAEVTYVDYCIGRLLKAIESMGLMDNTVIVFSTDHGTLLGEQGYVQKSPSLLNRWVSQIPLIIKHPDQQFAGKYVDGLVSAIDYMPTFLDLLGINDHKDMDGDSMWKLATGEAESIHDNVYTVYGPAGAIHNNDWHYFQNIKEGKFRTAGPALYDLKNDPNQTKNVIKEHPQVAREMRGRLERYLGIEIPPIKV